MQCRRCGKDLGDSARCNFCGYNNADGNVREMSTIEKDFYRGVTIDGQTGEETSNSHERRSNFYGFTPRGTYVNYSGTGFVSRLLAKFMNALMNNSILAKVAALLIVVAVVALMFFIALPILFVLLSIGIALAAISYFRR